MMHYNIEETEEKIYACWIASLHGIGRRKLHELVRTAGAYRQAYELSDKEIQALLGKDSDCWIAYKKRISPMKLWGEVLQKGICFTYYGASDFPQKLAAIPDPPMGLFYLGKLPPAKAPTVAMIGARKNSDYGRCMAEHFADHLARAGITVISGMAMGIDGISQRAALRAGGASYGILGCGVDVIYPPSNERLYHELIETGGVISEFAPKTEPRPVLFPQRNRIISALSDVVLVVEAREKSGTTITVDMALEQGREVYAIPGRCTDGLSMGCNKLLRQGAGIAVTPEEFIEDMGWNKSLKMVSNQAIVYEMSDEAKNIYQVLDVKPCTQEEIMEEIRHRKGNASLPEICRGLLELEMKQIVFRTGGQYYLTKLKLL